MVKGVKKPLPKCVTFIERGIRQVVVSGTILQLTTDEILTQNVKVNGAGITDGCHVGSHTLVSALVVHEQLGDPKMTVVSDGDAVEGRRQVNELAVLFPPDHRFWNPFRRLASHLQSRAQNALGVGRW